MTGSPATTPSTPSASAAGASSTTKAAATPTRTASPAPMTLNGRMDRKIPPGQYTITDVRIGNFIFVRKPNPEGEVEERWAEILSLRDRPRSMYNPKKPEDDPLDETEYYVHYAEFNKRLDEWVGGTRLILTREMELPRPKVDNEKEGSKKRKLTGAAAASSSGSTPEPNLLKKAMKTLKGGRKGGRKANIIKEEDGESDDDKEGSIDAKAASTGPGSPSQTPSGKENIGPDSDVAVASNPLAAQTMSKDDEIRRLRTSGSMTQHPSHVSRVKNLKMIQMGKHEVESWYFSPYPIEYAHIDVLYVCEFCLSYKPTPTEFASHRRKCKLTHPPGNEIYRDDTISFFEVDGRKQRTWCHNLCLLCKCFLDHKFLFHDTDPFLFYCMVQRDAAGCHLIGYFSKEKDSPEGYNLACILTLPQYQRKGWGRILIEFSYELSKVEKKHGSPEKPLSDLGLLSYRTYWSEVIVELLLQHKGDELSLEDIANKTCITTADVMHTLQALHAIKRYRGGYTIVLSDPVIESHEIAKKKPRRNIDPTKLVWKPPVFTRSQLAFGF